MTSNPPQKNGCNTLIQRSKKYLIANPYPSKPNPTINPLHFPVNTSLCRNSSRAKVLEICTSTTGVFMAEIASAIAIEVCEYAPALIIIPS